MIERVLIPLDGSALSECAIGHGVAVAEAFDAPLILVSVMELHGSGMSTSTAEWDLRRAEARAYLDEIVEGLSTRGRATKTELLEGDPATEILAACERHCADLIVMSSHGVGRASAFALGGTVQKVASAAGVSMMVVRPKSSTTERDVTIRYERVLAPVDCSQRADAGLCLAASLAEAHEAELLMAAVVQVPIMPRRVPGSSADQALAQTMLRSNQDAAEAYLEEMRNNLAGPRLKVRGLTLVSRSVAQSLHELAERENVGLIVLTAHGSSGASGCLYGSVTRSLLERASTPLLVLQDQPGETTRVSLTEVTAADRVTTW